MLLHVADGRFARRGKGAFVRRIFSVQYLEKRRLSGTVNAHKANTVAFLHFKCNILNNHIGAEHLFYVVHRKYCHSCSPRFIFRFIIPKDSLQIKQKPGQNHALRAKIAEI